MLCVRRRKGTIYLGKLKISYLMFCMPQNREQKLNTVALADPQ